MRATPLYQVVPAALYTGMVIRMMHKWGAALVVAGVVALAVLLWAVGTSTAPIGAGWAIGAAIVALLAGITLVVAARDV